MKPVQQTNRMIAKYDSLFITFIKTASSPEGEWMAYDNVSHKGYTSLKYHSSIEWLYPVARKVKEELEDVLTKNRNDDEAFDCYIKLEDAATTFELYLLYEVVCNVIEFLNKRKKG